MNLYPNGNTNDTVICTNNCNECNIVCDTKNQCKGKEFKVFSGAFTTNIFCTNDHSCEGASFYIGNSNNYVFPNGYNIDSFTSIYNSVNINCTGNIACKETKFYINGDYINGCNIDVHGSANFEGSILQCNLHENESCLLICGDDDNSCNNATLECLGGNCNCDGNGCSALGITSYNIINIFIMWISHNNNTMFTIYYKYTARKPSQKLTEMFQNDIPSMGDHISARMLF